MRCYAGPKIQSATRASARPRIISMSRIILNVMLIVPWARRIMMSRASISRSMGIRIFFRMMRSSGTVCLLQYCKAGGTRLSGIASKVEKKWHSLCYIAIAFSWESKKEIWKCKVTTSQVVVRDIVGRSEGLCIYISDTSSPSHPVVVRNKY
jgi:hypothetical protein